MIMMRRDNIEGKKLSRVGKLKGNKEKDCDGSLGVQDGGKSRETGTQKEKEQQHTPPPRPRPAHSPQLGQMYKLEVCQVTKAS